MKAHVFSNPSIEVVEVRFVEDDDKRNYLRPGFGVWAEAIPLNEVTEKVAAAAKQTFADDGQIVFQLPGEDINITGLVKAVERATKPLVAV